MAGTTNTTPSATTAAPTVMPGARPGLVFSAPAGSFRVLSDGATAISVSPAYLKTTAQPSVGLMKPKRVLKSFNVTLGGVLDGLVLPDSVLADSAGKRAITFDTTQPYDGKEDSFYLESYTATVPTLTALGVKADGLKLQFSEVSNHPELARLANKAANSWLGSVTLRGSKLSVPSIPGLSITGTADGADAFKANYDLTSGDLDLSLSKAALNTSSLSMTLANAQLKLTNSTKEALIKGAGSLSVPKYGINQLNGSLDLKFANSKLASLDATLNAPTPITGLGIAGTLIISNQFAAKTGTISLSKASIRGVGMSGMLSYSNTGDLTVDKITGKLVIDNSAKASCVTYGDQADPSRLSICPIKGTVDYLAYPAGAPTTKGYLNFSGVEANVKIGNQVLPLSGDLKFDLVTGKAPALSEFNLSLKKDVEFAIPNVGTFQIKGASSGQAFNFKLAKIQGLEGLFPSFVGTLGYKSPGGNVWGSVQGLSYVNDPEYGGWAWETGKLDLGASV